MLLDPWRMTSAPYPRLAATLSGDAFAGITTVAFTPPMAAAQASAWA